jgi:hypothetical protein
MVVPPFGHHATWHVGPAWEVRRARIGCEKFSIVFASYSTRRVPVRCYGQYIFFMCINLHIINISCLKLNLIKINLKKNAQIPIFIRARMASPWWHHTVLFPNIQIDCEWPRYIQWLKIEDFFYWGHNTDASMLEKLPLHLNCINFQREAISTS